MSICIGPCLCLPVCRSVGVATGKTAVEHEALLGALIVTVTHEDDDVIIPCHVVNKQGVSLVP